MTERPIAAEARSIDDQLDGWTTAGPVRDDAFVPIGCHRRLGRRRFRSGAGPQLLLEGNPYRCPLKRPATVG